ncbi:MAG: hypothetical protein AB7U98_01360 [Candidatus Nitrosocosmicus sp.]
MIDLLFSFTLSHSLGGNNSEINASDTHSIYNMSNDIITVKNDEMPMNMYKYREEKILREGNCIYIVDIAYDHGVSPYPVHEFVYFTEY